MDIRVQVTAAGTVAVEAAAAALADRVAGILAVAGSAMTLREIAAAAGSAEGEARAALDALGAARRVARRDLRLGDAPACEAWWLVSVPMPDSWWAAVEGRR